MNQTLTILRLKWYRGKGTTKSRLLTEEGKMCCLGFQARECGFTDKQIMGVTSPAYIFNDLTTESACVPGTDVGKYPLAHWMLDIKNNGEYIYNTSLVNAMMAVNDDENLTEQAREQILTNLFQVAGVRVKFLDHIGY